MKPRYALRCAMFCQDRRGAYRDGTQWVHLYGITRWVCDACAEQLSKQAGIPTRAQVRQATRRREAKLQLGLDLAPETHIYQSAEAQTV